MSLDEETKKRCVTVLPWGLYAYNMLPMGITFSSDVFQQAIGDLFADMEGVVVCLDDILIIGTGSYEEHLVIINEVLRRLKEQGL